MFLKNIKIKKTPCHAALLPRPPWAAAGKDGEDELVARRKASGNATPALSILSTGKDIYRPRYKLQNHRLKDLSPERFRCGSIV